jgi:adenylosuccinate lyase
LGHHHLALNELLTGLGLIDLDEARCRHELEEHPELLSEAVQSVLRIERRDDVYGELKRATRGKTFGREDLAAFVEAMPPPLAAKLDGLTPSRYLGDAVRVCDEVVASAREVLHRRAEASR